MGNKLASRATGFVLSLLLTITAYFIILHPGFFNVDIGMAITIIFSFAIIQSFVQLVFFINVWKEKGAMWNLGTFISTASIVFVIIYFSIWIMNHLNYNMG